MASQSSSPTPRPGDGGGSDATLISISEQSSALAVSHFGSEENVPKYLCCPITGTVMVDPVLAADGHTYEREAIRKWFVDSSLSPMTGTQIDTRRLIPNLALRSQIQNHTPAHAAAPPRGATASAAKSGAPPPRPLHARGPPPRVTVLQGTSSDTMGARYAASAPAGAAASSSSAAVASSLSSAESETSRQSLAAMCRAADDKTPSKSRAEIRAEILARRRCQASQLNLAASVVMRVPSYNAGADGGGAVPHPDTKGENGAPAYSLSMLSPIVALFQMAGRNVAEFNPRAQIADLVATENFEDIGLLMVIRRDVRNGNGDRDAFRVMLYMLYDACPLAAFAVLSELPLFGCFRDFKDIRRELDTEDPTRTSSEPMKAFIEVLYDCYLIADSAKMNAGQDARLTLAAKWAPREKQKDFKNQARAAAKRMFPDMEDIVAYSKYRKLLSMLSRTVEQKMTGHEWSTIKPGSVPGKALKKYRRAFLNQPRLPPHADPRRTGKPTRSDEPDRVGCAAAFTAHMESGKAVKGAETVDVYTLVLDVLNGKSNATTEAQYRAIVEKFKAKANDPSNPCALDKWLALSDVSWSMQGDPMHVSIALGILISDVSGSDKFLTFETNPKFHRFKPGMSFAEKVHSARDAPWGGSTNFKKALELLLNGVLMGAPRPEALVVISDMQFDAAQEDGVQWTSQYEAIKQDWNAAGYDPPNIIFWNVRDTSTAPAASNTPGVTMVSGFSQNMLKVLLENRGATTPEELVTEAIGAERYTSVKERLRSATDVVGDPDRIAKFQENPVEGARALAMAYTIANFNSDLCTNAILKAFGPRRPPMLVESDSEDEVPVSPMGGGASLAPFPPPQVDVEL